MFACPKGIASTGRDIAAPTMPADARCISSMTAGTTTPIARVTRRNIRTTTIAAATGIATSAAKTGMMAAAMNAATTAAAVRQADRQATRKPMGSLQNLGGGGSRAAFAIC